MHLVIRFLIVLLAAVTALGSPIHLSKKTLTINQVLKPRILSKDVKPHNGIASYAKALGKYGASVERVRRLSALALKHGNDWNRAEKADPQSRSNRRSIPSAIGSAQTEKANVAQDAPIAEPKTVGPIYTIPGPYDVQYVSQMTIGDRAFWIDFDTGSSDFWVFGPEVSGLASNQTMWHQSSTSSELKGENFYITYGDGSLAYGGVWKDEVTLGSVKVSNVSVEVADVVLGTFDAPSSGILGLGFDDSNQVYPTKQKTLFTNLIEQGLISHPIVSADLKHNAPGCYTFGDTPWWQFSGAITYSPVDTSDGYWTITPLGYGIAGNSSTQWNSTTQASQLLRGVIDTGTTLILMEDSIAAAYWNQVSSAKLDEIIFGGYFFNCSETLPDLKIRIGEAGKATYVATVPGTFMNYAPIGDGFCYGGMQPTLEQIPFNIYGDVLLKSVFAVFDRGTGGQSPRIGFADKKQ